MYAPSILSLFSKFLFCFFSFFFFFFNDTATTEIYTLSLHDALPILPGSCAPLCKDCFCNFGRRSEEHTSELQSRPHLVCRLLLEKKKKKSKKQVTQKKKKKKKKKKTKKKTP